MVNVDGIEIERVDEIKKGFIVDNEYLFLTDRKGNTLYVLPLKYRDFEIDEELKELAKTHILSYDIIKSM